MVAYGDVASIRFKCGNLGSQIPDARINGANDNATSRVNNETGRTWSTADGDDWLNIKLATEYYAAAECKSGIQGYEKSREDDIAEAHRLIANVLGSETEGVESSTYFVEASDYGTHPLNSSVMPYPWNLGSAGEELLSNPELD